MVSYTIKVRSAPKSASQQRTKRLLCHLGSITHLHFPLEGHKGRVNCVAIHPSGKVGLSVGRDKTLRMWDLMRCKASASTKLGKGPLLHCLSPPYTFINPYQGELVRWSTDGSLFAVQFQTTIDIYSTVRCASAPSCIPPYLLAYHRI